MLSRIKEWLFSESEQEQTQQAQHEAALEQALQHIDEVYRALRLAVPSVGTAMTTYYKSHEVELREVLDDINFNECGELTCPALEETRRRACALRRALLLRLEQEYLQARDYARQQVVEQDLDTTEILQLTSVQSFLALADEISL